MVLIDDSAHEHTTKDRGDVENDDGESRKCRGCAEREGVGWQVDRWDKVS